MSAADFQALLPLLAVAGTGVLIMAGIAVRRSPGPVAMLAILGLAASFFLVFVAKADLPRPITPLLLVDGYALFYFGLLIAASLVVALFAYPYLKGRTVPCEEFYLLLLLATLGTCTLAASVHFVSLFLGLEVLSVSLYAMIAYFRTGEKSVEAGIKYLILAAVSSAFLLFGMALIYARVGSMSFASIAAAIAKAQGFSEPVVLAGLSLMMVGVGFKLAIVPFHMWTPDVYEGAPIPATAYVATASKGAMAALLVRFAVQADVQEYASLYLLMALLAAASMLAGNILALLQNNVKRILAYSSIAHLGYVLVAFLAGGARGSEAVAFYLTAYFVTMLGAFAVMAMISGKNRDADRMDDFKGLARRSPYLAGIFTAMLLSLAGIPLTAGFVGKFLILAAGVGASRWALVVILVVGSVISLFYYLRIVGAMYMLRKVKEEALSITPYPSLIGGVTLAGLMLCLIGLGVWPAPFVDLIRSAMSGLF